jgi:flagellar hook-associated protein 1 FlgK
MASIFDVGSSALNSLQRAISTTGNNIANVNTEGYSRQQV